jgi:hypothetical protein
MKATNVLVPSIHLNGTSRDALIDGYVSAAQKIDDAMRALEDTQPNGRDYYPQGDGALMEAMTQHRDRVNRLKAVQNELVAIIDTLAG